MTALKWVGAVMHFKVDGSKTGSGAREFFDDQPTVTVFYQIEGFFAGNGYAIGLVVLAKLGSCIAAIDRNVEVFQFEADSYLC